MSGSEKSGDSFGDRFEIAENLSMDIDPDKVDSDLTEAIELARKGNTFAARYLLQVFAVSATDGRILPPTLLEYIRGAFIEILDFNQPPDKALNLRRERGRPRRGVDGSETVHLLMGLMIASLRQKGFSYQESVLQVAGKQGVSERTVERAYSLCKELALFFRETDCQPSDPSEFADLETRFEQLVKTAEDIPEPDLRAYATVKSELSRLLAVRDRLGAEAWMAVYQNKDHFLS